MPAPDASVSLSGSTVRSHRSSLMSLPTTLAHTDAIGALRAALTGRVITPDDATYDVTRAVASGFDRRPAVIVQPVDATEVARVIDLARGSGLPLAVRGGGHSPAGHSVCDDGIVLDLAAMRNLEIDVDSRTAWAETGLTAGEFTHAASEHGLACGFGDTASVGIGGLTLGGGIGLLTRKHGMTIDNVLAAEVVTADGQIRQVDADHYPDLFWAIRGGGGNVGVVTRLQLQLVEVDEVYGGWLVLPATAETVDGFVAAAASAPEELTALADVMIAPPLPFLPPECHGLPVIIATLCHVGRADDGERAVAPLRALASPIADMVGPTRYRDLLVADELPPHRMAVRTSFLDGVDHEAAAGIVNRLETSTAMMSTVQLRTLGGAMARIPADATAFAHRDRRILAMVGAMYVDPAEAPEHEAWVAATADVLADGTPGAYVNFLGEGEQHRMPETYPGPTRDRLAAIKTRYDHTNLFRLNHNVPPAAETGA
jgi:FAD/FMN-containing dehydrogenase